MAVIFSTHLSPGGAALPSTNFAAPNKVVGTNWTYLVLDYDQTTSESAFWYFTLPPNLGAMGTATLRVSWTATSGTGTVTWSAVHRAVVDDEVWDATTTPSTQTDSGTDTLLATDDEMQISIPLTITGWTAGDTIQLKLSRDISDTLNADARLLDATIEIQGA